MSEKQSFDKHFEEKIIQALVSDEKFAQQMMDVIELKYFELSYTTKIAQLLIEHHKNYDTFPTLNLLESILNREEKDEILKRQTLAFISGLKKKNDFNDLDYVKDKSLQFFKVKNLYRVLDDDILPLLERAEYEEGNFLEQISNIIQKATIKGTDRNIGYDYLLDDSERFQDELIERIATPWPIMNEVFRGGLGKKRLVAIIGGTGAGKTQTCINMSVQALADGKTVVYYNMEMPAIDVARRADACITGVAIDDVVSSKEIILKEIKEKIPEHSKLIIKTYPMKGASVDTLKNHLLQLKIQGIEPDMIVVDYPTLLRSSTNDKERRNNIEDIWIALKGLAQETNTLIVAPVQSNREGFQEDYIRAEHVADCFAIMCHADCVFTIQVSGDNQTLGYGKAYVAKNRLGPTGGLYCYKLIGSQSRVEILEITEEIEKEIEMAKLSAEAKKQQNLANNLKKVLSQKAE